MIYCGNAWLDQRVWLDTGFAGFQRIWRKDKPRQQPARRPKATNSSIDDAIDNVVNGESSSGVHGNLDEYDKWRMYEPRWMREYYGSNNSESTVEYWLRIRPLCPNSAQFALDIMTVPTSSCNLEREFSEVGVLLEPKRRKVGSNRDSSPAITCISIDTHPRTIPHPTRCASLNLVLIIHRLIEDVKMKSNPIQSKVGSEWLAAG